MLAEEEGHRRLFEGLLEGMLRSAAAAPRRSPRRASGYGGSGQTIVVGFDGSPAAERALERAAELTGGDGRVVVVTASVFIPSRSVVDEPIVSPSREERDALLERAGSALRSRDREAVLIASDEQPSEALVQAVRSEDADLIISGLGIRLRDPRAHRVDRGERRSPGPV